MRLINTTTLELEEFLSVLPQYGILSHTWGVEEVIFEEFMAGGGRDKAGFLKIRETCRLARERGLRYAWVDTCCINKSSSAELTEAINSMFRWYTTARFCFAHMEDLTPGSNDAIEEALPRCRWFTRGWTLQELIASRTIFFYDAAWSFRGTKESLQRIISTRTNVPQDVLRGTKPLSSYSIATRMSWAAARRTTRLEDRAYSLLGIFDVNMPLLYGEREKSFRRLQEEIVKRSNDMTIFAWEQLTHVLMPQSSAQKNGTDDRHETIPATTTAIVCEADDDPRPGNPINNSQPSVLGVFAPSPAHFARSGDIRPFSNDFEAFSITNRGLFLSGEVPLHIATAEVTGSRREPSYYCLMLGYQGKPPQVTRVGIFLRKVGPNLLYRDRTMLLAGSGPCQARHLSRIHHDGCYIITNPLGMDSILYCTFRHAALHIPFDPSYTLQEVISETLWDPTDRIVLRVNPYGYMQDPIAVGMRFKVHLENGSRDMILLCRFGSNGAAPDDPDSTNYERVTGGLSSVVTRTLPFSDEEFSHFMDFPPTPTQALFLTADHLKEASSLFSGKHRKDHVYWKDLLEQTPAVFQWDQRQVSQSGSIRAENGGREYRVGVKLQPQRLAKLLLQEHAVIHAFTVKFHIQQLADDLRS
jgi:hypothetical protein